MLTGMAIGTGIGFGAGFLAGVAVCAGDRCEVDAGEAGLALGLIGAGAGFLIGTVIGVTSSGDVWEPVSLGDLEVSVLRAGLVLRFSV